ncbi:bifunctional indole-3-glycerol-phosphate synthase TrpC/phosphoribosylanthranilate isomerase TrpF [Corynebacterium sp. P5848]|uniref:bifunctional indole-3-glycerol-phosphate synthase TrpC/phosphoribosylanthranilate isomerase TrpF n=1 Tax=Corynebacterium marambiense TaxID=2765364 RepID=UPI002260A97F|nr:bifunctional indole-3-glycerol-phosphate synthase TrpC/phosphoribosylanthranilate isomerase TrpF [Corynebacterium marambiense]MCX7543688.1 bifunctional indole-3-glycerol-phosphate synthase TrpC/phosphoribosylanthranilate isomerase TrpF [Corynebacterium marambiense]
MPDAHSMPTVLEGIVTARRGHLEGIRHRISHVNPEALPRSRRSLFASLGGDLPGRGRGVNRFIMECKSASPSLGLIREHYQPGDIARIYSRYASGISVLCEPDRFGGDYDHLATVAMSTHLPVLCKDFIIDEVQIHAARYFGADAILLMLSVLDDETYTRLAQEAHRLGLDILTEVVDEEEMRRARYLGARIIGINHRNLHDLSIDLSRSAELAPLAPENAVLIAESGIRDNSTVRRIGRHVNGFLVGSQLTGQPDIDTAARELVYGPNKVCGLRTPNAAQAARAAGAVYGGLIFEEASPRALDAATASAIIAAEPGLKYVAVSRRSSGYDALCLDGVAAVQVHCPLGTVEEEAELVRRLRGELPAHVELWRAFSMSTPGAADTLAALVDGDSPVDRFVLDSGAGGSGTSFDWSTIPETVKRHSLLAGGIGVKNLNAALTVGCAGVDLNSALEYGPDAAIWSGHKDTARLGQAFTMIRTFNNEQAVAS